MRPPIRWTTASRLVALVVAMTAWPGAEAAPPAPEAEAVEPLSAANDLFRSAYRKARAETMARLGPVILVRHDRLVLLEGGRRLEASVIPAQYHRLKEVAHVPLAVFVLLAPGGDGPLDDGRLGELRRLREAIVSAGPALDRVGFSPAQRERGRDLLGRSLTYLDVVLASRAYRRDDLDAFARAAAPLILANAADAAALQIEAYHGQVAAWRQALGPERWDRLRVVVVGRQLPRKGNVAVQYFARVLGEPGEGPRLTYAEELSGDDAALELLGTRLLDREIGRAFFGDPTRMERDLLGDAASEYLKGRDLGG